MTIQIIIKDNQSHIGNRTILQDGQDAVHALPRGLHLLGTMPVGVPQYFLLTWIKLLRHGFKCESNTKAERKYTQSLPDRSQTLR